MDSALDIISASGKKQQYASTEVSRPIDYSVDLGHLSVFDSNDYTSIIGSDLPDAQVTANIRDGVQALVNALWSQPTRASEDHTCILASLPAPHFLLPREKPIPKIKAQTKWEKFAQEKGIEKRKRSSIVYDDEKKDWVRRHGYKGANQDTDWLKEVPVNADPFEDQFAKAREAKKASIDKNRRQQERNIEISQSASPANGRGGDRGRKIRKLELEKTLKVTGKSTASMGRFDKALDTKGAIKIRGDKRKFESVAHDVAGEKALNAKIANKIVAPKVK